MTVAPESAPKGDSAERARQRFGEERTAARYPEAYSNSYRDRRERAALERALEHVPAGAAVLDLPCGTGRLIGILRDRGLRVTGADAAEAMVARARAQWAAAAPEVAFDVQDALATSYPDGRFDAVVCNRLIHHLVEQDTRRAALKELARISKGPVIVSFFNLASVGAWTRRIKYAMKGREITDRVAIPVATLRRDCEALGLRLDRVSSARRLLAQQTYAVITRVPR